MKSNVKCLILGNMTLSPSYHEENFMRGLQATLKSVSHEIIFFLKAGSGSMGEGPCRGM